MPEALRGPVILGVLLIVPVFFGWPMRWRAHLLVLVLLLAILTGSSVGAFRLTELATLPRDVALGEACASIGLWVLMGQLARAAGGWRPAGPPVVVAPLLGAALGELAAAAMLAGCAKDRRAAGRLALGAAAGGLLGSTGDATKVLLTRDPAHLVFLVLAVAAAAVAAPRADDLHPDEGNPQVGAITLAVLVVSLVEPLRPYALLAGSVVLALIAFLRRGPFDASVVLWSLGRSALAVFAVASGLAEWGAVGLENAVAYSRHAGPSAAGAMGVGLGVLLDGPAAALYLRAVLDRGPSLPLWLEPALMAGACVGGLGPLVVAGATAASLGRWLLQVIVTVVLIAILL